MGLESIIPNTIGSLIAYCIIKIGRYMISSDKHHVSYKLVKGVYIFGFVFLFIFFGYSLFRAEGVEKITPIVFLIISTTAALYTIIKKPYKEPTIPTANRLSRKKGDENTDIVKWKKIIGEVFYCLEYYARWYGNVGSGNLNDMKEAYDALQRSAHRLIVSANTLNCPINQSRVKETKALLLGISNTLIDGDILIMQKKHGYVLNQEESETRRRQSKENRKNAERIKHLLQCAKKT